MTTAVPSLGQSYYKNRTSWTYPAGSISLCPIRNRIGFFRKVNRLAVCLHHLIIYANSSLLFHPY